MTRNTKILPTIIAAILLWITGCTHANTSGDTGAPQNERTETKSVLHDGIRRRYHVTLPDNFSESTPTGIILVLHGGGGSGIKFDDHMTNGSLSRAANERSVVLVFPEGIRKQWNDGRLEILKSNPPQDDVGFISKIIDTMAEQYGIDEKRVYVTGLSNGGHMSMRLAMELSHKITAIAPVAAQLSKAISTQAPDNPISIMLVNGTEDPLVPFDGGHIRLFSRGRSRGEVLSAKNSVNYFLRHNGCSESVFSEQKIDKDLTDEIHVQVSRYENCRNDAVVTQIKVTGGGHTWPGGRQYLRPRRVGPVSKDINASKMIIDFFLAQSR